MHQTSLNFDSPHLLSDEEAVLSCLGHGRQAATSSTEIEVYEETVIAAGVRSGPRHPAGGRGHRRGIRYRKEGNVIWIDIYINIAPTCQD